MRRVHAMVVVVLLLLGSLTISHGTLATAQEATPPDRIEVMPGVTVEGIVYAEGQEDPVQYQMRLAPGASFAFEGDATIGFIYVRSGELTIQMDAPLTMGKNGDGEVSSPVPAGTEVTVPGGTYFVLESFVGGVIRNDSEREVVLTTADVTPELLTIPGS